MGTVDVKGLTEHAWDCEASTGGVHEQYDTARPHRVVAGLSVSCRQNQC